MLVFIESADRYSTYRDTTTGETVYLLNAEEFGSGIVRLYEIADALKRIGDGFRDDLEAMLIDPDEADEASQCERCSAWHLTDDLGTVIDGRWGEELWCDPCIVDHTTECSQCYEKMDSAMVETWIGDTPLCEGCTDAYTGWCEMCDERVWADHDCPSYDCDCEAPNQTFSIAGVGNDQIVDVSLPPEISATGISKIRHLVLEVAPSLSFRSLGVEPVWKDAKGRTYPKRLRKAAHDAGITLSNATIEQVGNIARAHSGSVDLRVAVTRDLNQSAGEFAHEGSCWWTDYSYSRCTLKDNHGFGLRSFNEHGYVMGRVWVMPFDVSEDGGPLVPTDSNTPDAFVVFNGYGDLEEMAGERALIALLGDGWVSTPTDVCGWEMYVNGESGHFVSSPEVLAQYNEGMISLPALYGHR